MSTQLFDLSGKTALVTGGTHGLGMAIATGLGNAGAKIVVNDIFPDKLEQCKKEYADAGLDVSTYLFDVTDEQAVIAHLERIEQEVGPIDILVNNAGIIKRIPILEMEADEFREVLDIDLTGPFIMSKHVVKSMLNRKAGGRSSICAR